MSMRRRHSREREEVGFARIAPAGPLKLDWTDWLPKAGTAVLRGGFSFMAGLGDVGAIVASAVAAGVGYHWIAYGWAGPTGTYANVGLFVALLFLVARTMRNEYDIANYLGHGGHVQRTFALWNVAFVGALGFAFLTKTTGVFSRATIVVFYAGGALALIGARAALAQFVRSSARAGAISVRRVFLVGYEKEVEAFSDRHQPWASGMRVVAAVVLRGPDTLADDLALAAASARMLRPDDVYILAPWSETATIDACVETFLRVPASIHLGAERVLDKFIDARISNFGSVSSLHIVRRPLTSFEVAAKRLFDICAAGAGLMLLAPLFALVALAIKLDSRGPVFFLQRRYGFNQEPFRIWKFRSMTTMDDGRHVAQARPDDPRITRVGRFMRRTNIDELPQLINVLRGDMSLVGPRPHALAHDQKFEQTIAFYARRHNMKPGITGWAQVNGCRGETDTEDKMRMRVEYDLHYIDNWSATFDLRIVWLTVFSRKAYRNAV